MRNRQIGANDRAVQQPPAGAGDGVNLWARGRSPHHQRTMPHVSEDLGVRERSVRELSEVALQFFACQLPGVVLEDTKDAAAVQMKRERVEVPKICDQRMIVASYDRVF